jgi:hypothetical protein
MIYFCCDDRRRRNAVAEHPFLNGIDFLEVSDNPADSIAIRQKTLFIHFIKPLTFGSPPISPPQSTLGIVNMRIEGGERIRNIKVTRVSLAVASSPPEDDPHILKVEVSEPGDFSTYTLRLVHDPTHLTPPAGFDPVLSAVQFSFKVLCPSDFDCRRERLCPEEPLHPPEIDYLAKDYASFRQLMLDRMALLTPAWKERNPADLGVALVELLAYVGDHLSYQQDAVATESYLSTARRRASVRRHVRLIDYPMHDGRNARVWVHLEVSAAGNGLTLKRGKGSNTTKLLTHTDALSDRIVIPQDFDTSQKIAVAGARVFEPLHDIQLFSAHNRMLFYTWGARECCLPVGATSATLAGAFPDLTRGDVLLLVESRGPQTGQIEDADVSHRHAVRLATVTVAADPLGGRFKSPRDNDAVAITQIEWNQEDALPFALCISSRVGTGFYDDVGIALGNIVLADHGMTIDDSSSASSLDPDRVPEENPALTRIDAAATNRCAGSTIEQTPPRYQPRLKRAPLTQASPYDPANPPDTAFTVLDLSFEDPAEFPAPAITLKNGADTVGAWEPKRELLGSRPGDKHFIAEIETDGTVYLRFGDDQSGMRPVSGLQFFATYRIGNGSAGNVGADTIRHVVTSDPDFASDLENPKLTGVRNPLPARGGMDAETIEHARQNAPSAFARQERAVTPADYEQIAIRKDVVKRCGTDVQRAAATLRWTGSWHTVFVTVDRLRGKDVDAGFERKLRGCLERYRMAGQDVEIDAPQYVSLEIEMAVCIKPGYFFEDVSEALLDVFSNRTLPDGRRGIFHPDNFSFGQPVYSSSIFAAAQQVAGVGSVALTKFQRQGIDSDVAVNSGKLDIGRLEIARLDNDPDFPEHGVFRLLAA